MALKILIFLSPNSQTVNAKNEVVLIICRSDSELQIQFSFPCSK